VVTYYKLSQILSTVVDFVLIPERRVLANMDALAFVSLGEIFLLHPRVILELVSCGDNGAFFQ
jgi:hypothetical protein